jgi:hypothetical protein
MATPKQKYIYFKVQTRYLFDNNFSDNDIFDKRVLRINLSIYRYNSMDVFMQSIKKNMTKKIVKGPP